MAGPSVAATAALIEGEDWHYVDGTDEPAFANSWDNSPGFTKVSFRFHGLGRVEMLGVAANGTPGATVFTLPSGYRPATSITLPTVGIVQSKSTTYVPAIVTISAAGDVQVIAEPDDPDFVWLDLDFYTTPPAKEPIP